MMSYLVFPNPPARPPPDGWKMRSQPSQPARPPRHAGYIILPLALSREELGLLKSSRGIVGSIIAVLRPPQSCAFRCGKLSLRWTGRSNVGEDTGEEKDRGRVETREQGETGRGPLGLSLPPSLSPLACTCRALCRLPFHQGSCSDSSSLATLQQRRCSARLLCLSD